MGGQCTDALIKRVTHLVTNSVTSGKYKVITQKNKFNKLDFIILVLYNRPDNLFKKFGGVLGLLQVRPT